MADGSLFIEGMVDADIVREETYRYSNKNNASQDEFITKISNLSDESFKQARNGRRK